ncbi:hypothetical protein [Porphyromonas sp.]
MSNFSTDLQAWINRERHGCINTRSYILTASGSTFALRDKKDCTVANLSECLCTDSEGDIKLSQANSLYRAEIVSFDLLIGNLSIQGVLLCDFVVTPHIGDEYIVFCELTRALESSVEPFIPKEGDTTTKYSKAYNQCCDSITWCIEQGISFDSYEYKKAFFGWREIRPLRQNKATKNMLGVARPRGKPNAVHKIVAGFQFQMVRYPEVAYLYHG